MYRVAVVSPKFVGLSRVQQHRMVNECLKDDIKLMHGIQLTTATPPP
jgi:stress-induced morphogen